MANRKHLIFWLVAGLLLVFAGLRDIYAPGLLTMHRITFSRSQVALELAARFTFYRLRLLENCILPRSQEIIR